MHSREEAIELVQVLDGLEDEMIDQLLDCRSDWEAALAAYARGAMAEAARLFDGLAERLPGDPARAVFHARARDWLERGVPAGWDGVENWADILRGNPAPQ